VNLPQALNETPADTTSAQTKRRRSRAVLLPAVWGLAAVAMVGGAMLILDVTDQRIARPPDVDALHGNATSKAAARPDVAHLSEEIATLKADREKLIARLEILERQAGTKNVAERLPAVEDPNVTGSVTQASGASPASAPHDSSFDTHDGPVRRIVFGIDLGSAPSVDRLKDRWVAMSGLYGATLAKLEPKVVFGRSRDGAIELRLLAGPFQNAESAVKACASLQTERATCEPRPFEGESLPKS
jgi:hypothetical protein